MLATCEKAYTRAAFAEWLRGKYADADSLSAAWGILVTFPEISEGKWTKPFPANGKKDAEAFSTLMTAKLFDTLTNACRKIDARHLNLGARYYTAPPAWATAGMNSFDVFSVNGYSQRPNPAFADIAKTTGKPVMIGEWHFGALDAGLPATGIGLVATQEDRGKAYRIYLESAAAAPWCIGAHWFTFYDQSALGRNDGECYNIGFFDTAHQPYLPMTKAVREAHEAVYRVASGEIEPYADAPEYLPMICF
jgi:hypothetical protein